MLLTTALVLSLATGELDPQKAAQINLDQRKAMESINKKYGNKKPSELSGDEKRAIVRERAEAEQKALDKAGVSAKDWARFQASQSPTESKQLEADTKALAKQEKDAEEAKKKADAAPKEIPIQRGFSDEDPVVMEEMEGATPRVDSSIPPGEQDDSLHGTSAGSDGKPMPPPTVKTGKGGKRGKGGRRR